MSNLAEIIKLLTGKPPKPITIDWVNIKPQITTNKAIWDKQIEFRKNEQRNAKSLDEIE